MAAENKKQKDTSRPVYYKTVTINPDDVDVENRIIKFYAAIWGNKDDADDILVKGCCAKSIQERGPGSQTNRKILFLWMHDVENPLGKPTTLKEDEKGLYVETPVDKIPEGDRCLTQLKSGTLNQFSIGYSYIWDKLEYDQNLDAFIVKEINLFEVSVVSFGCNEETGFEGMKSADLESERNKLTRDTERVIKALPYEEQYKVRQLISRHIALSEAEPIDSLKEAAKPPKTEPTTVDFKSIFSNALKQQ